MKALMFFAKRWNIWLAFIAAILPATLLGISIAKYNVNVPFFDQWDIAPYIIKLASGEHLNWSELIAQHNESRLLFPKLIFIGLADVTHWDVRYEMLVTFLLACLISINIYRLNRITVGGNLFTGLLIVFICNLLIFSPIQHENWLWGFQLILFIPITCITTGILVAYSHLHPIAKFLLCICLATISTFSFANGMLCWIVLFPVLVFHTWQDLSKYKWLLVAWIATFTTNLIIYFYGYQKPTIHPSFREALVHPIQAINFFFAFLGSPLGFKNLIVSTIVGIALVLAWIGCCFYLFKFRQNYLIWTRVIGWLSIGTYAAMSSFIVTLGRLGFGADQALTSRYTTVSLYFTVALIHLGVIIIQQLAQVGYLAKNNQIKLTKLTIGLVLIFIVLHILSWDNALGRMSTARRERLQGKACLLLINVVSEERCLTKKIYPNFNRIKYIVNSLEQIGLIQLVETNKIKDMEGITKGNYNSDNYGSFDSLAAANKDEYIASGWAILPDRGESADLVILTYENANTVATVFAVAVQKIKRKDLVKTTKKQAYYKAGWQKSFATSKLPKGLLKINAWAFDTNRVKAFKIGGNHLIQIK